MVVTRLEYCGGSLEGVGGLRALGGLLCLAVLGLREVLLEGGGVLCLDLLALGSRDRLLAHQLVGVDSRDERVGADLAVKGRLGERGLVGLVVAVPAEAVHVDEHVALPLLAEVQGELRDHAHGLRVVAVHVEDRGLDHLRHVGAVARRARVPGIRGEADLVVDDEVKGAPGPVAGQLREVEGLRDDSLACDRGVAVDQEGKHKPALVGVPADALPGAGLALHDGIHDLEVGGIGREANLDLLPGGGGQDRLVSQVVLHVAVARHGVGDVVLGELLEELVEGLAHDAAKNVEAPAVGHPHDDLLDADVRAVVDHRVEGGDDGLAAFEREALLANVLCVQELLEELGLVDPAQDPHLLGPRELRGQPRGLNALLQPAAAVGVLDVGVLNAHVLAVGFLQGGDDVLELHLPAAEVRADVEGGLQVGLGEVELGKLEFRGRRGRGTQGVEASLEVANGPVGRDQVVDVGLLEAVDDRRGAREGLRGRGQGPRVAAKREALEEGAPRRVDGVGVLLPRTVHLLEEIGVCGSG